jgi:hypothetical protein
VNLAVVILTIFTASSRNNNDFNNLDAFFFFNVFVFLTGNGYDVLPLHGWACQHRENDT